MPTSTATISAWEKCQNYSELDIKGENLIKGVHLEGFVSLVIHLVLPNLIILMARMK